MKKETLSEFFRGLTFLGAVAVGLLFLVGLSSCGSGVYDFETDETRAPEGHVEVLQAPSDVAEKYSVYVEEPKWEDATLEAIAEWNRALGAERFTMEPGFKPVYIYHPDENFIVWCDNDPTGGCTRSSPFDCDVQIKNPSYITHELGHCAGFGHSNDPKSVMFGGDQASDAYFPQEIREEFDSALAAQNDGREGSRISYTK